MPASARPIADENGRTARLHYSTAHLRKIFDMKKAGRRVKIPDGVTMEQLEKMFTGDATGSTETEDAGNLSARDTATGTAGPVGTGE